MPLDIDIAKNRHTYWVKLTGSLDTETSPEMENRMEPVLADPDTRTVQLDLSGLEYISSIGLGLVAKIRKTVQSKGGLVLMIGAQPQIIRTFQLVKMMPQETVFSSREEADAYLADFQKLVIEEKRQPPA